MPELVAIAIVFFFLGLFIGLAWKADVPLQIADEPIEHEPHADVRTPGPEAIARLTDFPRKLTA